jgi:UDP-N-acetylmuramate dehydrogenase
MKMAEPIKFIAENVRGTLRCDVDMRRHTSWRAGGRVARMYQAADLADLAIFLRTVPIDEPLLALGLGSNLLVRDGGLAGTALLLHGGLKQLQVDATGCVYAQAGVPGAKLARFAALNNWVGGEFFAGIPGTVGGMLAMNAGCYGSETWDKIERVQVIDRHGVLHERTAADYAIGYRHVALCAQSERTHTPDYLMHQTEWFVGAWFKFSAGDGEVSRQKIKELLTKRIASQPLNLPNAGSVFRNPPGEFAARLIDSCGLKGKQIGGAQVSLKHANFIVNTGDASASDIESLIETVQTAVAQQTGIKLQCEVRIIGDAA